MSGLSDSFQRPINYLRISVTDRCNFRCIYCTAWKEFVFLPHNEILSYEEIHAIVEAAASLGISKVRLTGGEPLARSGVTELIRMLSAIKDLDDISLTTNGVLLDRYAAELKQAGLHRVNVSLDTLDRHKFEQITGSDALDSALAGIEAAHAAGLHPIKINMVVMGGINDDEVLDFAFLTKERDWHVRFIELMPFVQNGIQFVSAQHIQQQLASLGELEPFRAPAGNGPAKYYRLPRAQGTIGFITPVSEHFCFRCNRLRLTANGKLLPCLLSSDEIDLRPALRGQATHQELKALIEQAVASKPRGHALTDMPIPSNRQMTQMGG